MFNACSHKLTQTPRSTKADLVGKNPHWEPWSHAEKNSAATKITRFMEKEFTRFKISALEIVGMSAGNHCRDDLGTTIETWHNLCSSN